MKRLTARQRLLLGALLVAALIGGFDWLTRGGRPAPAHAGPAEARAPQAPAGWQDIGAVVERLTHTDYVPVTPELARLERDLFLATPAVETALAAAPPEADKHTAARTAEPDFAARHRLTGVVVGHLPLAVVNDRVLTLGTELEGCQLSEVGRDYVVFQEMATGRQIRLELAERPENP